MKRLLPLLCLLAAFSTGAQTAPLARPAPPVPSVGAAAAPQQFTLSNGFTVIVQPDRRAPTVVQMVWVRVGSLDEVDGTSGVAHALEHMMFKGSAKLAPGEFSRRVAALGGRENAFTSRDHTGYYQQIPAAKLEDAMRLESDRFANNRWPDTEFAKEIEVIKEERRMRTDDNPRAQLFEQLMAAAFQASPIRRPVIGWMNDIEAMTADDVRAFHHQWYVPANAALVVAGDVDPATVRRLAERYYGGIPARAVPVRKPREEPPQQGLRRIWFKAPAEQAYVLLAFKAPRLRSLDAAADNDDALALTVLAAVLDGYSGARLDRALTQGPDRVADSVGASHALLGRGPAQFYLTGVPAAGKTADQVEAALREQVARVAREGISEAELARVKTQWVAGRVYERDSVFDRANELGSHWVQGLPLDTGDRIIERLRGITAAQVQQVAARYFGDDQLTVATLVPLPVDPNRRPRAPAGDPSSLR
ncbi:M16 family metallopeptidase [Xylophilus sp.]|uniref:M16 family metallopeptidase n=1 Tax=Xylophilus sp. TaxID=2653893 RepID=UPI0013BC1EDF|nr:pitrilysin family protein [Xylophilus sp.]KAF1048534.1 MAG: putative zinc protease [Xylophilus sp.]